MPPDPAGRPVEPAGREWDSRLQEWVVPKASEPEAALHALAKAHDVDLIAIGNMSDQQQLAPDNVVTFPNTERPVRITFEQPALIRSVVPVWRSWTNTSGLPFVSPRTLSVASEL